MQLDTTILLLMGIAVLVFAGSTLAANTAFRGLVEYQFQHHRDDWRRHGSVAGDGESRNAVGFWNLSSEMSAASLFHKWLRANPDWAVGDIRAIEDLCRMRRWWVVAVVAMLVVFLTATWSEFLTR